MGRMKELSMCLDDIKADGKPIGLEPFITKIAGDMSVSRSQAQGMLVYLINEGLVAYNYEEEKYTPIHCVEEYEDSDEREP